MELLAGTPQGRSDDLGGPQVLTLEEMAGAWREARGAPRRIVRLPLRGRVAQAFREGLNTCPDHAGGRQTWSECLQARAT